jgi:hypothetical protein
MVAREQTDALCPFNYNSLIAFLRQNTLIFPFLVPTAICVLFFINAKQIAV